MWRVFPHLPWKLFVEEQEPRYEAAAEVNKGRDLATTTGRHPSPPVLLIFAITITGITNNPMLTPALPNILEDFGVGSGSAGVLVASGTLPGIVMAPLIGLLADRYGRRRVLIPCLAGFGLFGLVAALSPSFSLLLGARFAQGLGSGGLINLGVVIIGDHWEGEDRTRLVGRNSAVLTAALATLPTLSGFLTDIYSWRAALATHSLGIGTAILVATKMHNYRPGDNQPVLEQLRHARRVVFRPIVLATYGTVFVMFIWVFGLLHTTMPLHLESEFGFSASMRGLILSVPALPATLSALNLARIRGRLGIRRVLVFAAFGFAVSFAIIGQATAVLYIVLAIVVFGFGQGIFVSSLQDVALSSAPSQHRGAVMALFVSSARAGQTVGPVMASSVVAATSTYTAFSWGAGLALALGMCLGFGPITESVMKGPVAVGSTDSAGRLR